MNPDHLTIVEVPDRHSGVLTFQLLDPEVGVHYEMQAEFEIDDGAANEGYTGLILGRVWLPFFGGQIDVDGYLQGRFSPSEMRTLATALWEEWLAENERNASP